RCVARHPSGHAMLIVQEDERAAHSAGQRDRRPATATAGRTNGAGVNTDFSATERIAPRSSRSFRRVPMAKRVLAFGPLSPSWRGGTTRQETVLHSPCRHSAARQCQHTEAAVEVTRQLLH